jgi:hypothetical protein
MKASYLGSPAEKARFKLGWQSFRERKADGHQNLELRCSGCRHVRQPGFDKYRCEQGILKFATAASAICREFSPRPKAREVSRG